MKNSQGCYYTFAILRGLTLVCNSHFPSTLPAKPPQSWVLLLCVPERNVVQCAQRDCDRESISRQGCADCWTNPAGSYLEECLAHLHAFRCSSPWPPGWRENGNYPEDISNSPHNYRPVPTQRSILPPAARPPSLARLALRLSVSTSLSKRDSARFTNDRFTQSEIFTGMCKPPYSKSVKAVLQYCNTSYLLLTKKDYNLHVYKTFYNIL